ncbi:antitoxin [Lachnospiraceae bacterium 46-61]
MGTAATRAKNKYAKKNYDRIILLVPIGQKQKLVEYAQEKGYKSTSEFIKMAIKEKQERESLQ